MPRAGPKYRLGMYFDTIHEIPEFDAVLEAGYQSHWETDTEIQTDDEYGSFLFSKVDGDSASVICIEEDEAVQLIQRFKLSHQELPQVPKVSDVPPEVTKMEATYENMEDEIDEHVYESIDDCREEYQLFLYNDEGSPSNNVTPVHHTKITHKPKASSSGHTKTKRSNSLPFSATNRQQESPLHNRYIRKYSDCTEYSKLSKRHHRNSIDKDAVPPPLPPPNETHNNYATLFGLTDNNKKTSPSHQQVVLKHKGREYVLPLVENNSKPKRTSPKHMNHSTSTNSHLNNYYSTILPPSPSNFQIKRSSPPRLDSKYDVPNLKKKSKASTTHSAQSGGSSNASSKRVTLYGVL